MAYERERERKREREREGERERKREKESPIQQGVRVRRGAEAAVHAYRRYFAALHVIRKLLY